VEVLTIVMKQESIDLVRQIERCRRLASFLTDEQMRSALVDLADDYEAELKRRPEKPFMLRRRD
jgi:hypothetical protein